MSGKSRRSRAKRSYQGKKKKVRLSSANVAAQPPAAAQATESVMPPRVAAPPARVPTPAPKPAEFRYPFITTELRRIGILAGIMLVVLVVLAVVLS
jgi:hypothetical protein